MFFRQAATFVRNAIVNCYVLPWPNSSNQAFDRRSVLLQEYVHNLSFEMMAIQNNVMQNEHDKVMKAVTVVLPALNDVILSQ